MNANLYNPNPKLKEKWTLAIQGATEALRLPNSDRQKSMVHYNQE